MIRVWLLLGLLILCVGLILLIRAKLRTSSDPLRSVPPRWLQAAVLWLLPLPVLVAAIVALARGLLTPMLGNAAGYGLYLAGAWLLWRGLSLEAAGARRSLGRTPWPLKTLGGIAIGLGTGITAWLGVGHHPGIAAAFGLLAWLGCWLFHGGDAPRLRRRRGAVGRDTRERVIMALAQAEQAIDAIEQSSRQIAQTELRDRLQRITRLARDILTLLEEHPRELHRARRFLNVYLDGVQRVVDGYAKTHQRTALAHLDERLRRVLEQIEAVFREQREKLVRMDVMDLDVEIEVLMSQLKREGLS